MNEPTTDPAAAETVTGDDLLLDSAPAGAAPPPPPAATAPAAPPVTPAPAVENPFAGVKDSRGVEFHPAKFRLKDGRPQLDSLNRFCPLAAGRGGKAAANTPGPDTPATEQTAAAGGSSRLPPDDAGTLDAPPEISAELSVEVAIGMIQAALIMIGQEEGILDDMEQRMCRGPFQRLIQKYNLTSKMTPELESAAIVAMLLLRRLKKPKTQSWFQQQLAWLRGWWISFRVKKAVPEPMPTNA